MSMDIVEMFFCCVKVAKTFFRKIVECTAESKPNQKPLKEDLVFVENLQLHFLAEELCVLQRVNH